MKGKWGYLEEKQIQLIINHINKENFNKFFDLIDIIIPYLKYDIFLLHPKYNIYKDLLCL